MLHNKRARSIIIVVGLACAGVVAVVLATRGLATQGVAVPNVMVFTVSGSTPVYKVLPLNTPVSISIAGRDAAGKTRAAWVVACCENGAWSCIGQQSDGGIRKGNKVTTFPAILTTYSAGSGTGVIAVDGAGKIRLAPSYPMRVYINY
jgi:hypothetical protein